MRSLRKQVADLERRILILEQAAKASQDAEDKVYAANETYAENQTFDPVNESARYKVKDREWVRVSQDKPSHLNQQPASDQDAVKKVRSKLNEALVGRYLIGALASLLVFVGAVSLVALFWGQLTPQIKLGMLVSVGVILTAVGLVRIKKHNNPVTSIILGTGSGLLFISILAANLAFALISSATAYLLAGIWSISFMVIYGYTKTFFTTLIAYIGSYIAMGMGIYMAKSSADLFVIIIFTLAVILVLLGSAKRWLDIGKQLICTALSWFSISSLIYGGIDSALLFDSENISLIFGLLILLLYAAFNRFSYLNDKLGDETGDKSADKSGNETSDKSADKSGDETEDKPGGQFWFQYASLPLALITGLITIVYTYEAFSVDIGIKKASTVLLGIFIAQCLYNEWRDHSKTKSITIIFSIFQGFAALLCMMNNFDLLLGFSLPAALLLVIGTVKKRIEYRRAISTFVLLDAFLTVMQALRLSDEWTSKVDYLGIYSSLIVILLLTTGLVFVRAYSQRKGDQPIVLYKIAAFAGFLTALYGMMVNLFRFVFEKSDLPGYIGLAAVSFAIAALFTAGYFKDWKNEEFKWFDRSAVVRPDGAGTVSYFAIGILYFASLLSLYQDTGFTGNILLTLTALCLALLQSANIMLYYRNDRIAQVWLGLKYLILSWAILFANSNLEVTSVYVSITGLSLALLSIAAGFKLKLKGLRLYGLILTILMVLKFIVVDLNQENSITRVAMLMVGGLICFGISVLYNRLENLLRE